MSMPHDASRFEKDMKKALKERLTHSLAKLLRRLRLLGMLRTFRGSLFEVGPCTTPCSMYSQCTHCNRPSCCFVRERCILAVVPCSLADSVFRAGPWGAAFLLRHEFSVRIPQLYSTT